MAKLYEILIKKINSWLNGDSPREESKIFNPIGSKIGNNILIDSLDYRGLNFFVKEIREHTVILSSKKYRFVDYILAACSLKGDDVLVKLRLLPQNASYKAVVLHLYDEFGYNDDFKAVVNDKSKKFNVDDDEINLHEEYWRINDVGISLESRYLSLVDENNDGKVNANELISGKMEFWDYSRLTTIDSVEIEQFLFVEMNKEDGWFQIWRGTEVPSEKIEVL